MNRLKLCILLGIVGSLSVSAWGIPIPSVPNGPVYYELTDHDNGTSYSGDEGTYTRSAAGGTWTGPGTLTPDLAPGATTNEDTWGVFAVQTIRPGIPKADPFDPSKIVAMDPAPGTTKYYVWDLDATTGLVGMFYGGWDSKVVLNSDGSFEVYSEDVHFELWAVDKSLLYVDAAGTTPADYAGPYYEDGRRDTQTTYENWVDSDDATKQLLIHATSTYFGFNGQFDGTYFTGHTDAYWAVDETETDPIWNEFWGQMGIFTDPDGNKADLWTAFGILPDPTYGWRALSSDDGGAMVVPEPMTMLGLFLGVTGLGGYLRRRNARA